MNKTKWNNTMLVYDEYEKRFAKARLNKNLRFPWEEQTREEIINEVKKMIAYDESLIPKIKEMREVKKQLEILNSLMIQLELEVLLLFQQVRILNMFLYL